MKSRPWTAAQRCFRWGTSLFSPSKVSIFRAWLLIFVILLPSTVRAHKVYVFAWVEDGRVMVEGYAGDRPVREGHITVTDNGGKIISRGMTDDKGMFSFSVPDGVASDLQVVMDAGSGHRAHWTLELTDITNGKAAAENGVKTIQKKRAEMKAPPSMLRIITGIALIFVLFWIPAGVIRRRRRGQKAPLPTKKHHG